jgi:hypothetical protein
MRPPLVLILSLALLGAFGSAFGQELPGPDDRLLEKSDAVLVSAGGAYDLDLKVAVAGNRSLEYELRNYVKDSRVQRAIFQEPGFDRDDSAIRNGDMAYFKYRVWPKYDAMNARSSFLDSPFSWEDALGPGLSGSYELAGIAWDGSSGERLLRCELKPLITGSYRRIDAWIRPGSYQTVRRIYYTPSGLEWKAVNYGGYVMEGGIASAWEMTMVDELTNASASISVRMRRLERMPDSFFEPRDRSKER